MRLIDSHSHFDDARFTSDREQAYTRARDAGVVAQILPAVTRARWPTLSRTCERYTGLYPAYGLHPMFMAHHAQDDIDALAPKLRGGTAVAVGECGLDYYIGKEDRTAQIELFGAHLELAKEVGLPLIIHARKAVEDVINLLRNHSGLRGVCHSFSGSQQQAERLFEMGFLVSFGGPITYPRANRLHQLVANLPLEAIMLESDAPDQPDVAIRGERNEPARVRQVLNAMTALRHEERDQIARQTTNNAITLFALPLELE